MQKLSKKNLRGFTLIELMIVVVIIGILASLAIYGVQKYVRSAKNGEAKNTIGAITKSSVAVYEGERMSGAMLALSGAVGASRQLCVDPPNTVPTAGLAAIAGGLKYQSTSFEWNDNDTTPDNRIGWTCLRFNLNGPQYFVYAFDSDAVLDTASVAGGNFTVTASADFDNDTRPAVFSRQGLIEAAPGDGSLTLKLSPAVTEVDAEE